MGSNQRTLGIVGASMLLLGFFLPAVSFLGLLNFSYFDLLRVSARFTTGLVILALGGLSLFLALKNNFKPLIGTGILALAILIFDFITFKKAVGDLSPAGRIGTGTTGAASPEFGQFDELAGMLIQPGWGMYIIAIGAILLIIAGALKNKSSMNGPDWNRNPPPPMNYS